MIPNFKLQILAANYAYLNAQNLCIWIYALSSFHFSSSRCEMVANYGKGKKHCNQFDFSSMCTMWRIEQICVFEHSVMTNFNCACPAIQRSQGSGFLSEGSSWLTACMSEQRSSGETAWMHRLAWTFASRICDKYQIHLTRPTMY